jgi:hypothetical protein
VISAMFVLFIVSMFRMCVCGISLYHWSS